jgi:hypothetical protein
MAHIVQFFWSQFTAIMGRSIFVMIFFPLLGKFSFVQIGVPTFVEHNPFGRIRCIDRNNPRLFKMLFVKCSRTYQPTFYNSVKLKLKQKVPY